MLAATKEKSTKTENKIAIKTDHKPKSYFNNDSSYNKEGAEVSFKIDNFVEELYADCISKGYNIREVQQLVNNSVTKSEAFKSVQLSEKLYQEARKKVLDERVF